MENFDRNKVMRSATEGTIHILDHYKDADLVLRGIEVDDDMIVVLTIDLNGTFLPLHVLKDLARFFGDENLWVCPYGNDAIKLTLTNKLITDNYDEE